MARFKFELDEGRVTVTFESRGVTLTHWVNDDEFAIRFADRPDVLFSDSGNFTHEPLTGDLQPRYYEAIRRYHDFYSEADSSDGEEDDEGADGSLAPKDEPAPAEPPLHCTFCEATAANVEDAIDKGWVPGFWVGEDDSRGGPVCEDCNAKYLSYDEIDGERQLREDLGLPVTVTEEDVQQALAGQAAGELVSPLILALNRRYHRGFSPFQSEGFGKLTDSFGRTYVAHILPPAHEYELRPAA